MNKLLIAISLLVMLLPFASPVSAADEASPLVIGVWKLVTPTSGSSGIDTEFRFINPTPLTEVLEYAFFEENGTFCGCDRDMLPPNKTTVYTASGEQSASPPLMTCTGTNGALKSIVFRNNGEKIFFGKTLQTGFQTHVFGNVSTSGDITTGNEMTESGMKAVGVTEATAAEILKIHEQCEAFPPVGPLCPGTFCATTPSD